MAEGHVHVKTTYGYFLHLLCVGFTTECNSQIQKTSMPSQICQIWKKTMETMTQEVKTNDLKEVVNKLIPESIGKDT